MEIPLLSGSNSTFGENLHEIVCLVVEKYKLEPEHKSQAGEIDVQAAGRNVASLQVNTNQSGEETAEFAYTASKLIA